jgi:hypothetical protein
MFNVRDNKKKLINLYNTLNTTKKALESYYYNGYIFSRSLDECYIRWSLTEIGTATGGKTSYRPEFEKARHLGKKI